MFELWLILGGKSTMSCSSRKNKDVAERYNCTAGGEVQAYDNGDADGSGDACAFRCPLKHAMQMVVSKDPERPQKWAEYNKLLEEISGEAEEG